jgi:serine/threonine protein kinase/Tfp pilus assembly protein PilF
VDHGGLEHEKELFFEALELDGPQREALLERHCAGMPALRARVEALLRAHARSPRILTGDGAAHFAPQGGTLAEGERLGPYRIVRVAGQGGFGTVYEAWQDEPVRRRVALKLLHRGLDSGPARARFEAERQALARMDHPHIARVFDAGTTTDGRPWFVLEFVDGAPLSAFADAHGLDLPQRLALFRLVCLAVQHAHQKGVVHRDIKQSNVLVGEIDGAPAPKVIDFGVAKAVDGELGNRTSRTLDGQWLGTPATMSPEQAAGDADVDTRADVYGLGCLLYELLAGAPPFEFSGAGLATILETIAHVEPQRPSARAALRVPSDLDWIVLRCLEKDRARRYASAQALADDVARFLGGLPVEAAPPSTWYRIVKLTRRHSLAVGAAATVALTLAVGGVGTALGWMRAGAANRRLELALERVTSEAERARVAELSAAEEARRATTQAAIAQAVNDFVNEDLLAAAVPSIEPGKGREVSLRSVLDAAARGIEGAGEPGGRFAGEPLVEASIRAMLGAVYGKLGEYATADPHLRRALALREAELGERDPRTLEVRVGLSANARMLGHNAEAEEVLAGTLELQREVLGPHDLATVVSQWQLGLLRSEQGRSAEAFELLDGAWTALGEAGEQDSQLGAAMRGGLAIAAHQSGRDALAEQAFRESFELHREHSGPEHPETVSARVNLAAFLRSRRRYAEVEELLASALEDLRRVLGPEHPTTLVALYNLGAVSLERGRGAEAEARLREALAGQARALGPDHPHALSSEGGLARSLALQGRLAEAEAMLRSTLERAERTLGSDHPITDGRRRDLALLLYRDPARTDELFVLLDECVASQRRAFGDDHPATLRAVTNLARLFAREGDAAGAEELLRDALARCRAGLGPEHLDSLEIAYELAGVLLDTQRPEEALELSRQALAVGERVLPADDYDLARVRLRLGIALRATGSPDEGRAQVEGARAALIAARDPDDEYVRLASEALAAWDEP